MPIEHNEKAKLRMALEPRDTQHFRVGTRIPSAVVNILAPENRAPDKGRVNGKRPQGMEMGIRSQIVSCLAQSPHEALLTLERYERDHNKTGNAF